MFRLEARVLPALIGRDRLGLAVTIQVRKEDSNKRPSVQTDGEDEPIPPRRSCVIATRVLEIDEVRQFAGDDDVRVAVAIDVGDIGVLGCCCLTSFRESREGPLIGVFRAERQPDIPVSDVVVLSLVAFSRGRVGLMNRDDVHDPVAVEVTARQAVAPIDGDAADGYVIDDVLPPGNIGAIRGLGGREGVANARRRRTLGLGFWHRRFLAAA